MFLGLVSFPSEPPYRWCPSCSNNPSSSDRASHRFQHTIESIVLHLVLVLVLSLLSLLSLLPFAFAFALAVLALALFALAFAKRTNIQWVISSWM